MTLPLELVRDQLTATGYEVVLAAEQDSSYLKFENDLIMGFVLEFADSEALIEGWQAASQRVLHAAQFALRRAETKSWNTYVVFLTRAVADYGQNMSLATIEENLTGTRKIARAGIESAEDVRAALLPLLDMQNAPRLEAVDMTAEIRLRTSELPKELIDAFVEGASESTVAQLLETGE